MKLNRILKSVFIFIIVWIISLFPAAGAVIAFAFISSTYFSLNLEMGWMAVIIIFPPLLGTLLALPLSFLIIKKSKN